MILEESSEGSGTEGREKEEGKLLWQLVPGGVGRNKRRDGRRSVVVATEVALLVRVSEELIEVRLLKSRGGSGEDLGQKEGFGEDIERREERGRDAVQNSIRCLAISLDDLGVTIELDSRDGEEGPSDFDPLLLAKKSAEVRSETGSNGRVLDQVLTLEDGV